MPCTEKAENKFYQTIRNKVAADQTLAKYLIDLLAAGRALKQNEDRLCAVYLRSLKLLCCLMERASVPFISERAPALKAMIADLITRYSALQPTGALLQRILDEKLVQPATTTDQLQSEPATQVSTLRERQRQKQQELMNKVKSQQQKVLQ